MENTKFVYDVKQCLCFTSKPVITHMDNHSLSNELYKQYTKMLKSKKYNLDTILSNGHTLGEYCITLLYLYG